MNQLIKIRETKNQEKVDSFQEKVGDEEERRRKEEKEKKKRDWEKKLSDCDRTLNLIKERQVSVANDITAKVNCLDDKRCKVEVIAFTLKNLNQQQTSLMKEYDLMRKEREGILKHLNDKE